MSNTKLWAITILAAAIGWVLLKAAPALQPALIAVVIAYLLNPLVELIEQRLRIKRWVSITILLVITVGIVVLLMNLIIPPLVNQATQFVKEFDSISKNSNQAVEELFVSLENQGVPQNMVTELRQYFDQFIDWLGGSLVHVLTSALGFIFGIIDMFLVLIMVIYFLASGKMMVQQIVNSTQNPLRQTLRNLISGTHRVIWSYVKTQVLIALIVGVLSTVAFLFIGIKFAVLLGFMAGILNFIPYIGSIIAGAVAALVALLTGGLQ